MDGKQLKNSILQWAIQGKLVPQDPNDEPAIELLHRINPQIRPITEDTPFDIPDNWCWCRIQQVIELINGRAYKREELLEKGKYKVLRVGNFFTNNTWYYSDLELPADKYCNKGDLLYAWSASFGPQIWNGDKTIFHYHIWNVKYNPSILMREYLFYFLLYDKTQIQKSTTGSTMVHVSMENMNPRLVPIPPLAEQQRIVARIVELMPLVERYAQAQASLDKLNGDIKDKLKKSILQEAIQGKLMPQDPNDEPAIELLEKIRAEKAMLVSNGKLKKDKYESVIYQGDDNKYYEQIGKTVTCIDEDIPFEIPNSWEWVRIHNIVQINPKNESHDDTPSAFIPMEKIGATYGSKYTYDIVKWGNIRRNFTHFANGDVAFAKITPCFQNRKSAIFKNLPNSIGAGTTELKVLRPFGETINRWYLLYFLKSPYFIEEATFKGTANQQRIVAGYLENKLFPIPPLAEQKRIVARIVELFAIVENIKS